MTVPQLFLVVAVVVPLVLVGLERLRIDLAALLIVCVPLRPPSCPWS